MNSRGVIGGVSLVALVSTACSTTRSAPASPSQTPNVAVQAALVPPTPALSGGVWTIVGPHNWVPVAGARVQVLDGALAGKEAVVRPNGGYRFDEVQNGPVSVQVVQTGYRTALATRVPVSGLGLNFILIPAEYPVQTVSPGEEVQSTVNADDPICDTGDPTKEELDAPCRVFQISPARSGTLMADLSWNNPGVYLELLTPSLGKCCRSPVHLELAVEAGLAYTISVGFHGTTGAGANGTASFVLQTLLAP
jgi:hypothetical protein